MPPMNPSAAYAAALGGPQGMPEMGMGEEMAMPEGAAVMPRTPKDVNPMTQQGDVFFLDPAMLPEGKKVKVGDKIMLQASVQSIGSKIGLIPEEASCEMEEPEENGEEMGEEE
jgi:hypothetical protein